MSSRDFPKLVLYRQAMLFGNSLAQKSSLRGECYEVQVQRAEQPVQAHGPAFLSVPQEYPNGPPRPTPVIIASPHVTVSPQAIDTFRGVTILHDHKCAHVPTVRKVILQFNKACTTTQHDKAT